MDSPEEVCWLNPQRAGESADIYQAGIHLGSLDTPDIVLVKAGSLSQLFLGEFAFQPERAHRAPKLNLNVCWHRLRTFAPEGWKLKTQPCVNTIVLLKGRGPRY